jgi:hypothetical protein
MAAGGKPASAPPAAAAYSLHIRVRAFAVFSDEAVDPRGDNGQRYRAKLEHSVVESADVEFRSERFLRFFAGTHDRELAHIISAKADGV